MSDRFENLDHLPDDTDDESIVALTLDEVIDMTKLVFQKKNIPIHQGTINQILGALHAHCSPVGLRIEPKNLLYDKKEVSKILESVQLR